MKIEFFIQQASQVKIAKKASPNTGFDRCGTAQIFLAVILAFR